MVVIFGAVFGLIIGSFINALVWRTHEHKSVAKGRSMCPNCKHELGAGELVPVASYVVQGGKCRHCHKPISAQYPLVEVAAAAVFALAAWRVHPSSGLEWFQLILWLYFSAVLLALAVYDLRWMILPNKFLLPAIVVAAAYQITLAWAGRDVHLLLVAAISALGAGGVFYLLAILGRGKWLGGGDIKLAFLIGLLLPGLGTLVALMFGFDLAAIVAVGLIIARRKTRRDVMAFGPYLVLGTYLSFWWGGSILNWYLNLVGAH